MQFSPYYPIKPFVTNQDWGTYDSKDYAQFGFTRHNGVDIAIGADALVRAPFDGHIFQIGNQPNGGGIFIGFISDDQYEFDAFTCSTPEGVQISFHAMTCYVLIDFLHLKSVSASVGVKYKAGDVLAVQDNTGFSTGPHTHIQPRRVSYDGKILTVLDANDAHNSFDPSAFWNGVFAADIPTLTEVVQATSEVVSEVSTAPDAQKASLFAQLAPVFNFLASLFKGRNKPN